MNQDDIMRMANNAGFRGQRKQISLREFVLLARFAALVAEHEREAEREEMCKWIESKFSRYESADRVVAAIRARGTNHG
jgi:hypothetical protein